MNHNDPTGNETGSFSNTGLSGVDPEPLTRKKVGFAMLSLGATFAPTLLPEIGGSAFADGVAARTGAETMGRAAEEALGLRADLSSAMQKIANIGKNNATRKDFSGVAKEVTGKSTGFYHVTEMKQSIRGLDKVANTLSKGLNDTRTPESAKGALSAAKNYAESLVNKMKEYLSGNR